ncbi:MAG: Asp-tRNA(Asn)/Glu-tRNA(Gln) amidotransferase subunit GatB [Bdellovibrionales bacterium]|nr:Asp-tRNA(Asn)/Glu-tRNA(Gln) amidotransferase subunit GatB [Bdellovibrionales bacterium]
MRAYEAVIGLEVHAQLLTNTKAFCLVASKFGESENTQVGPVSGGLPGALPVLNERAVELAVRAGLALGCRINRKSVFSRKNYFYPDLPKGYQISQFDEPTCSEGAVEIRVEGRAPKRIEIERIHMEEDAGKSMHLGSMTLVNLNRSGVPLVEIVSRPDMRTPFEASAYLRKVHAILVYAGVCDGNLEEGNFRCDANVSVRPLGQKTLGTRTELKNINSFRFVEKAIDFEIARQIAVIEGGGKITQETRGWDAAGNKTFSMRSKEEAQDYRYFPEPDLPPLILSDEYIQRVRQQMPELPEAKQARFVQQHGLTDYDAEVLTSSRELAAYFEAVVSAGAPAKPAANWITSELLREMKDVDTDIDHCPIRPEDLAALVKLVEGGKISGKIGKTVFADMFRTGERPDAIIESKGLVQVSDAGAIEAWVDQVIAANPGPAESLRAGKTKLLGFFVGEIMKLSQGKANPGMVSDLVRKKLGQ